MNCPDCGYILGAFESECPRCRAGVHSGLRTEAETSAEGHAPEIAAVPPVTQRVLVSEDAPHLSSKTRRPTFQNELYLCRRCGAANPPHGLACEACGETIGYDSFFDALRDPGVKRATIESAVVMAVMLLCLHVFAGLPELVQASVGLSTVIVLAWRFLQALEGRKG